jgi:5-methylcytosine-specific restriction endonuclease McrA
MINNFKRYQSGLKMSEIYPTRKDGLCSCGCGVKLGGRRKRWATKQCSTKAVVRFKIIKGDIKYIRNELYRRDKGKCSNCGETTCDWDADHILPVCEGGGACELGNFQTLCKNCHKNKTNENNNNRRNTKVKN